MFVLNQYMIKLLFIITCLLTTSFFNYSTSKPKSFIHLLQYLFIENKILKHKISRTINGGATRFELGIGCCRPVFYHLEAPYIGGWTRIEPGHEDFQSSTLPTELSSLAFLLPKTSDILSYILKSFIKSLIFYEIFLNLF